MVGKFASRMTVDAVHRLSGRPWLFLTGRLDGQPLRIGQSIAVESTDGSVFDSVIRTIEMHARPGTVAIAIDVAEGRNVAPGDVVLVTSPPHDHAGG